MRAFYGVVLPLLTGPAFAQDVTFGIFGIQIEDTPAVVTEALTAKGFVKYRERRGPTFDEQFAIRRKKIDAFTAKGRSKKSYTRETPTISPFVHGMALRRKGDAGVLPPEHHTRRLPAFQGCPEQKYGKAIKYAGAWIDRPVEKKKGFGERKSDETISVVFKCSLGDRLIDIGLFGAPMMLSRMLDNADGEAIQDF
ncbi:MULTISPECIES: hypothetical protein [unclassified Mesorhizobium]|uniref:hypothetical protein n=1 Tax=unclassified Mesorhizobium TaxID=325217 RepID=UPI000FD33A1F|nr:MULTISPECIES: hypothetical protein [unclassified Mesorhizobium]RUU94104.1 hypothetical protein EOA79_31740 [Mesorhizobium sp. M1A.F.Ca.IN.020.03.2.1]RWG87169.1 MAG: hypothetical protein EOQ70_14215 [Mesorhizobium sp.]RWK18295.1 MAG: hypothetical protein EOR41_14280 [Mesorhizobium sp.]